MRTYETESTWKTIQSFLPGNPKGIVAIFHGVGGNGRLAE